MSQQTPPTDLETTAADVLGGLLRESDDGRVAPEDHFAQRDRFVSVIQSAPRSKRTGWRWGAAALLAAILLVGAVGLVWRLAGESVPDARERATEKQAATESLSLTVDGVPRTQLGVLLAQENRDTNLEFSDGSTAVLEAGSALRLLNLDAEGAGLVLVDGGVRLEVVHREATRWWVGAGPYTVRVTGTRFDVRWDARAERLQVDLLEGQVLVDTPWLGEPVQLAASQRLVAQVGVADVQIGAIGVVEPVAVFASASAVTRAVFAGAAGGRPGAPVHAQSETINTPDPDPESTVAAGGRPGSPSHAHTETNNAPDPDPETMSPTVLPTDPVGAAGGRPDWPTLVAAGEFEAVITAAEEQGLGEVLVNRAPDDLIALSEAARYTKRAALARKALITLRARFGSSGKVADVTFFLGRLEEQEGDLILAVDWYGKYSDETPGGRFAEQALGRKMVALVKLGQGEQAKEAARSYLDTYAGGTYEGIAKEQVSQ